MNGQTLNGNVKPKGFLGKLRLGGITILIATGIAMLATVALPVRQVAADGSYYFSFENGLAPWQLAGTAAASLQQVSGDNGCPDLRGNHYAHLEFTPSSYGGTATWMTTSFQGSGLDVVTVDWTAVDKGECKGVCQPIVYVGADPPTDSSQFEMIGDPTGSNWQTYHYPLSTGPIGIPNNGTIYVAIGFGAGGGNIANVTRSGGVDCVSVNITAVSDEDTSNRIK